MELAYFLILGSLLFNFGLYYLLKTYLVEWGCRRFLKDRVKIAQALLMHGDVKHSSGEGGGATEDRWDARASDKSVKGKSSLTTLSKGDMAEIAQLMVSQVISISTVVVSLLALFETSHDCIRSKSPLLVTYVHFPAWYMIYDSFAMFDAFTLRKNLKHLSLSKQFYIFTRKKLGLVFHHIILFFCGYPLVLNYSIRLDMGDFVIALFFFMDVTNPFLNMAMILKVLGLTHTKFYLVNGVILLSLWFFVRVLNYPVALVMYVGQYHHWNILSALSKMRAVCHFFSILHFGFQTYWFYQIFKISIRTTFSKTQKTS